MFFLIVNKRGYLPSSPLQATFVAFLFTPKYDLQNLGWTFCISDVSHLFRLLASYAPHTSQLYSRIGEIIESNILKAIFGVSL